MTKWTDRVGAQKGATVDALLASLQPADIKRENLEAVKRRKVTFEGFHTIDFGAVQLNEATIRAIAAECGIENLLKPHKKDREHLMLSRITPPFGQLYTQEEGRHAGTRVDIKQLTDVKPKHLQGLIGFIAELQRLHAGIIAFAENTPEAPQPARKRGGASR